MRDFIHAEKERETQRSLSISQGICSESFCWEKIEHRFIVWCKYKSFNESPAFDPLSQRKFSRIRENRSIARVETKKRLDSRHEVGFLCSQGSRMAFLALAVELMIDGTANWVHANMGQLNSVGLSRRIGIQIWKVLSGICNSQVKSEVPQPNA